MNLRNRKLIHIVIAEALLLQCSAFSSLYPRQQKHVNPFSPLRMVAIAPDDIAVRTGNGGIEKRGSRRGSIDFNMEGIALSVSYFRFTNSRFN